MKCKGAILVLIAIVAFWSVTGCRSTEDQDGLEDAGAFDASISDDGGQPVAPCMEGATYSFNNDHSPFFGGEESVEVEVAIYSNFYCTHCAEFAFSANELWEQREDYRNKVRFYFHHWANTPDPSLATMAAYYQGAEYFWTMHDYIFERLIEDHDNPYTLEDLYEYAGDVLGLDMAKFDEDVNADETLAFLAWDKEQGEESGVIGVPTLFICGEKVPHSDVLDFNIESIIDEYLE